MIFGLSTLILGCVALGRFDPSFTGMQFNENHPWITALNVQTGATDAHLDLTNLLVSNLEINVGAASTWVRLPATAKMTNAHIAGGAATITLEIPPAVGAQIRHRGGLSTVNVDQSRFPAVGEGLYRSADYQTAPNNVDISIETGVTSIQVN